MFSIRACVSGTVRQFVELQKMSARRSSELAAKQNGFGGKVHVRTESDVAIITMDRGENRMNDEFIDQMNAALDEALRNPDIKAVITTGNGKFYNNGLDLMYMIEMYRKAPNDLKDLIGRWQQLELRMLTFPVATVAALNGHTYAGGAIFSLCHDYRIMQNDRGWWCMNEAHMNLIIPEWILRIYKIKVGGDGGRALLDSIVYGKRFSPAAAKKAGIVDDTCANTELIPRALALINETLPSEVPCREYVEKTKRNLFKDVIESMSNTLDISQLSSRL